MLRIALLIHNWANHGALNHVRNMYRAGWSETFGEFVKRTIKKALFDFMFPALLEFLNRCMAMKILQWPIKNHSLYGPYFTPIWSNQATYFSILVLSTISWRRWKIREVCNHRQPLQYSRHRKELIRHTVNYCFFLKRNYDETSEPR